jgi:WD40 repeat protein
MPFAIVALSLLALADEPIPVSIPARPTPVSYANEVADVLGGKCVGCHNAGKAESKLVLEDVAGMLKGGKRGPAIVPGKAEESLLFRLASHRAEPPMPPKDKPGTTPMTPQELGLIKLWIDAGAKDDTEEVAAASRPVELGTLPPGVHPIVAVDMTADGRRVACGRANLVQVYDADSGLEIVSLAGHKDIIQSLRFSPDGARLAAGSYEIATLWNCPTGGEVKTLSGHEKDVRAVAPVAGGKAIVSAGMDKTIRLWDDAEGKGGWKVDSPTPVLALAVSPDGRTLAAGGEDGVIRLYKRADGSPAGERRGHFGKVTGLAYLPDGRLASASEDGTARVWPFVDADGLSPRILLVPGGPPRAIAATPDGRAVVTGGGDGVARLWDASDGRLLRAFEGHARPVVALAVGPSGDVLATGSEDGTARLFDMATGATLQTLRAHRGPVRGVSLSPDGTRVVTAGAEGGLVVWEAATGRKVLAFGHGTPKDKSPLAPVRAVAFFADGAFVSASGDGTLKTWAFSGSWSKWKTLGPHPYRVLALDFNPDGTLLAAGAGEPSRGGEVAIWETGKGLLIHRLEGLHSDSVLGVRFSPDGTKLATASADKFLKVVDVTSGRELRSMEGHNHHVLAVDWSGDGKQVVTGGADNVLKIWDAESGEPVRTTTAVGKQISAVRWSRNTGTQVVAGACGDSDVRLWNPANGRVTRTLQGPDDFVYGVALSADRSRVAAGGSDGILYLWNGDKGDVIRTFPPGPGSKD